MYLQLAFLLAPITLLTSVVAVPQAGKNTLQDAELGPESLGSANVSASLVDMEVKCYDEREAASISDCAKAMMAFPQNLNHHLFHRSSPPDIYQLPTSRIVGSCIMEVGLTGEGAELTSWLAIGTVALQLMMACASQRLQYGFGVTGGHTNTGDQGRITVQLKKYRKGQNEVLNSTQDLSSLGGKSQSINKQYSPRVSTE